VTGGATCPPQVQVVDHVTNDETRRPPLDLGFDDQPYEPMRHDRCGDVESFDRWQRLGLQHDLFSPGVVCLGGSDHSPRSHRDLCDASSSVDDFRMGLLALPVGREE
jgi:hypothetical protein